jgi:hypothetical protein
VTEATERNETHLDVQMNRAAANVDRSVRHAYRKVPREDLRKRKPNAAVRVHKERWRPEDRAHDVLLVYAWGVGHPNLLRDHRPTRLVDNAVKQYYERPIASAPPRREVRKYALRHGVCASAPREREHDRQLRERALEEGPESAFGVVPKGRGQIAVAQHMGGRVLWLLRGRHLGWHDHVRLGVHLRRIVLVGVAWLHLVAKWWIEGKKAKVCRD